MPRDTPEERRARDEALGVDVEAREEALVAAGSGEVLTPASYGSARYGRRSDVRSAAMVASAARVNLKDRRAIESLRRRRQAWQTEAWDYFDEVGEIGYTTTYIANLMSKLRLYPAVDGEDGPVAVSVLFDEETDSEEEGAEHRNAVKTVRDLGVSAEMAQTAMDTIGRLRSQQGGQSAILRELSLNLEVAGECYVHGHQESTDDEDPGGDLGSIYDDADDGGADPNLVEDWNVRSVDELVAVGDEFQLRRGPGMTSGMRLPDDDLVIRLWERHPRFSEMATCAMRRVLAEAEALLLLSREIRATSKSRLSNGILLIPSELSFGSIDPTRDEGDGEETDDPFDAELQEAMITPIQEEGSASAVVPLVLRGPAELLQHVNHLALDKSLDPVLDARIEQRILRIARGLNMPTEVTTGLMATTFANAVQVKRSEFEDHIEPRAVLVCDAITSGYFQWALEVAGCPTEVARKIFVWFDASALIRVEDQSEQAVKAHEDGVISDAARRRYTGFKEEDAPDAHELAMRILLRGGRIDPTIFGYLLRAALDDDQMPVPAPPAGVLGVPQSVSALPVPGAPPTVPVSVGGEEIAPPPPEPAAPAQPNQPADPGQEPNPEPPVTEAPPPAPVTAAGDDGWGRLGAQLVGVDRELRSRIIGKLDQAMMNALERAGVRIKARVQRDKGGNHSALRGIADSQPPHLVAAALGRDVVEATGLTSDELLAQAFDSALESVSTWLRAGSERAMSAVEKAAGAPIPDDRRQSLDDRFERSCRDAVDFLRANLHELAQARLYSPDPAAPEAGEYDGTVLIPASMVRVAIAIAGGEAPTGGSVVASAWLQLGGAGPVTTADGDPLGGVGTGPAMMSAIGGFGARTEGWQWAYGEGMRSEFLPHVRLDGTVVATTDDEKWANSGGFPATDYYFPGDHDGCFPAGTPVSGPLPVGASLRYWEGELVEISLASGQLLTATPNHPVLTRSGWVPIGSLDEGDEVVRCIDGEGISGLVPNGYQMPTPIEEVADTFGVHGGMRTARVKVAAENFHGDGAGSQVAVVGADRDLRDRLNAALGKPASESPFPLADPVGRVRLPGESRSAAGLEAVRPAPLSLEGMSGDRPATLRAPGGVDESLSLSDGPDGDATLDEPSRYRLAGSAQALSENLDRLAGFVAADKVLYVDRHPFAGHVYNLDTRVEWYIAGGILVRNCVCDIIPVLVSPAGTSLGTQLPTIEDFLPGGVGEEAAAPAADEAAPADGADEQP